MTFSSTLVGQFDVVLDSGTIEHVFHIPDALKNVLSLAQGGRVICMSPSSNHVDNGFDAVQALPCDQWASNGEALFHSILARSLEGLCL
jgi:hypothetical protein